MPWDEYEIFKILPFYNSYIKRPKIKKLSNVQLFNELPFYDDLSIIKNKTTFSGYVQRYKIEIVDKKDVITKLKVGKLVLKICLKTYWLILKILNINLL